MIFSKICRIAHVHFKSFVTFLFVTGTPLFIILINSMWLTFVSEGFFSRLIILAIIQRMRVGYPIRPSGIIVLFDKRPYNIEN